MHSLDVRQIFAGLLYPFVFFLGVPRREVFSLAYVMAGKMLVSSDVAYAALSAGMVDQPGVVPFSERGFAVIAFALADGASLGECFLLKRKQSPPPPLSLWDLWDKWLTPRSLFFFKHRLGYKWVL